MSIEAMKQALEALELFCEHGTMDRPIERREALRQAIEQAEKQEPAAKNEGGKITWLVDNWPKDCLLYTTLPVSKSNEKKWIDEPQKVVTQLDKQKPYGYVWTSLRDCMERRFSHAYPNDFYKPEEVVAVYIDPPQSFTYDQVKAHIRAAIMSTNKVQVGEDITNDGVSIVVRKGSEIIHTKFYPIPPRKKWAGLTDEDANEIFASTHELKVAIRLIEATLRKKNT